MALYEVIKDSQGVPTGDTRLVAGGTLWSDAPIGVIYAYCGSDIPTGWKYCNGQELSKTEYADLYAVIGDAFKGNKTPTTGYFCLPDLRECTLKGASDTNNDTYTIGTHQKIAVGEFLDDRVQDHQHKLGSNDGTVDGYWATNQDGSSLTSSDLRVGGSTADNPRIYAKDIISGRAGATTEVKSVGVNYIIKAKMVALPADLASGVEEICSGKADRITGVTAENLGFENGSTQSVTNTLKALGDYNVIQFRWGSATSFNISDGTNTISSSGGSIIRANGESAKKEAIFISGSDKNVYIIGFKRDTTQYIEKLVTASDLAPTEITGTGTTGLGFTAKKSGNVVTVYLYCTADVSGGQSISFGTLPAGYRPPRNVKFLIHSNNGSLDSTQGMFADISSYNGGIASYSYVAITTGQCGVISYIVD